MISKRRLRFTREGIYYTLVVVAVLIGASVRQLNLLMLLGSMLTGPLLFSLVYGRVALRRIQVERRLPPQLHVGERLTVDVTVTNRRRWMSIWSIEIEDRLLRDDGARAAAEPTRVGVYFPTVRAGESRRSGYQGQLTRRGRYRFGPIKISTRFPLGLVRHTLLVDEPAELLVHPRLGRLARDWQLVRQTVTGTQGVQRRGMLEADFYGLRDWRSGDNRRWIHWRTSARRGTLVVRQFDERRSRDLAVLVDLWQPEAPTAEQLECVERAVSFVATLVAEGCRQPGRRMFLALAADKLLERSGPASPAFLRQQLDELALVAAHHEAGLPAALGDALAQVPPAVPTILISTRSVDWQALADGRGDTSRALDRRRLHTVDVSSDELNRYCEL